MKQGKHDGLTTIRILFLAFCSAVALVGVVVAELATVGNINPATAIVTIDARVVGVALALLGSAALLIGPRIAGSIEGHDELSTATSYRARFFSHIAVAQSVSLGGFVAFMVTGNPVLYVVGAVFTAIGYLSIAPTAGHLARDQQSLHHRGVGVDLVHALGDLPPARRR